LIKKQVKSGLSFSKKELNGLISFCVLLLLIYFAPSIYQWAVPPEVFSFNEFRTEIARFNASEKLRRTYSYKQLKDEVEEKELAPELFEFNPNGLSESSWRRLGLSVRQIKGIKNYERKGGRFFKKEDLKKLYTITPEDYVRLEPYIRIPERESSHTFATKYPEREKKVKPVVLVELNSADSALLETVNGIGPAFASRIIKYRNRLGGFHDKQQLMEVYGLDSTKYHALEAQVQVDVQLLKKININTAAFEDLKSNPYLSYKQMNALIQYRKQHGNYSNSGDLKKVAILPDQTISKLLPYLSF
jgi:DNA uptake protein ComE-like DNA-binding protein